MEWNYTAQSVENMLEKFPEYKEKLYCKGFLLTDAENINTDGYPFYGNWEKHCLSGGFSLYVHKETKAHIKEDGDKTFFLVGHAYNPYSDIADEDGILLSCIEAYKKGEEALWEKESEVTGVYLFGFTENGKLTFSADCTGMQLSYHGIVNGNYFVTSHSKLVGDMFDLKRDKYVEKLIRSRFYKFWGMWLPGDLSPYAELKRTVPNFAFYYSKESGKESFSRYYPTCKIEEVKTEEDCEKVINDLCVVISKSLEIIGNKWRDKKVAIAVTGGRDSTTTLSAANGNYDKFDYFSYESNYPEHVDAEAAGVICKKLGLKHSVYKIPSSDEEIENRERLEAFAVILQCNAGCIGKNNPNDVRKRYYFCDNKHFDVEVKSWVNEMGRGLYYNKYQKRKFPKKPYASYLRSMHKVYVNPVIIHKTDKIFKKYIATYWGGDVFDKIPWLDAYQWEFSWSGGEGVFLTAEHRVPYEIVIPFNNRKYVEKMLEIPLDKKIADYIPQEIVKKLNPAIAESGVLVKDVEHTDRRSTLIRTYLEVFSKLRF